MRNISVALVSVICVVVAPASAAAQWFATPHVGAVFGARVADAPKIDYGVGAGWLGNRYGFEIDASDAPDFFSATDTAEVLFKNSHVTTVMGSVLVTTPVWRVRPYLLAGAGVIRTSIGEEDDFVRGGSNNFGFNLGGGVMGDLRNRFGWRADLRYIRNTQDIEGQSEFFSFGDDTLAYWRATGGLTIHF